MALNIFYSHAWADKKSVLPIKADLDAAGFTGWIDETEMGGGDKLFGKIADGIDRADVIVVFLSGVYVTRENCRKELSLSVDYKKQILPVLLEGITWPIRPSTGAFAGEMAGHLTGMLYVDASSAKIRDALLRMGVKPTGASSGSGATSPVSARGAVGGEAASDSGAATSAAPRAPVSGPPAGSGSLKWLETPLKHCPWNPTPIWTDASGASTLWLPPGQHEHAPLSVVLFARLTCAMCRGVSTGPAKAPVIAWACAQIDKGCTSFGLCPACAVRVAAYSCAGGECPEMAAPAANLLPYPVDGAARAVWELQAPGIHKHALRLEVRSMMPVCDICRASCSRSGSFCCEACNFDACWSCTARVVGAKAIEVFNAALANLAAALAAAAPHGRLRAPAALDPSAAYRALLSSKISLAALTGCPALSALEGLPFKSAQFRCAVERTGADGPACPQLTADGAGPRGLVIYIHDFDEGDLPESSPELLRVDKAKSAQPALSAAVVRLHWTSGNAALIHWILDEGGRDSSTLAGSSVRSFERKQLVPAINHIAAMTGWSLGACIERLKAPDMMPQTKICIVGLGFGARVAATALQFLADKGFSGATAAVDSCILARGANGGPWRDSLKSAWAGLVGGTAQPLVNLHQTASASLSRLQHYLTDDWAGGPIGVRPLGPHLPPGRVKDVNVSGEGVPRMSSSEDSMRAILLTPSFKAAFASALASTQGK